MVKAVEMVKSVFLKVGWTGFADGLLRHKGKKLRITLRLLVGKFIITWGRNRFKDSKS